jgi:hypothetical protein
VVEDIVGGLATIKDILDEETQLVVGSVTEYVIVQVPTLTPVTTPVVASTEAILELLELQTPPTVALFNVTVFPIQTPPVPPPNNLNVLAPVVVKVWVVYPFATEIKPPSALGYPWYLIITIPDPPFPPVLFEV